MSPSGYAASAHANAAALLRRQRLERLLLRLSSEGSSDVEAQAARLSVASKALRDYMSGVPMPEAVARDIEWTLALPVGWLDGQTGVE